MLALHEDPNYEDLRTCHLYTALGAAMQIQKKKVIVGPADSVHHAVQYRAFTLRSVR